MSSLLAVDTATERLALGLIHDGHRHVHDELAVRSHAQRLRPALDELMRHAGCEPAQLSAVVCGIGPGSFAGVRIGVGFARALAFALERPVVPVTSLEALAADAMRRQPGAPVLACIDARMNEVYWAVYEAGADGLPRELAAPAICAPAAVPVPPSGTRGAGSGFALPGLAERGLVVEFDPDALPGADAYLRLGEAGLAQGRALAPEAVTPLYLRNRVALTTAERAAGQRI